MGEINVILNGVPVKGSEGMTILELAQENNVDIPTLCHIPELSPTGACRMCVVEIKGARRLAASCHTPIQQDMEIQTHSPKVLAARRTIIELIFASHSGDCSMCDKANICELRKIAAELGVGLSRAKGEKFYRPIVELNPYIIFDTSKCISCRKCVRVCREIKKAGILGIVDRGAASRVVVNNDNDVDMSICESCDLCVEVCPVGALVKKSDRFSERKEGVPLFITG